MTKFRIVSLCICVAMILTGAVYLAKGQTSLPFVLPLLTVCLWALSVSQGLDIRASGGRGIITLLPAIAMAIAAVMTTLATLSFFMKM